MFFLGGNPMEEPEDQVDAGAMTGLDPVQIEYARILAVRNANANPAMNKMWVTSTPIDPAAFTAGPGHAIPVTPHTGNTIKWNQTLKPMAILHEPTQAEKDTDQRRHLKLFVHFAKQFAERYPKWNVIPDPNDPLHSVHLVHKERGALIHNLYPMNEMAVYGGPESWNKERRELGQHLPIVKINTQLFWGWCVGMDDIPEWMIE